MLHQARTARPGGIMYLYTHLIPDRVLIAPKVSGRSELFHRFGEVFEDSGIVDSAEIVARRLEERESILSTGIGLGVAIPHAQVPGVGALFMAASVHPQSLAYPALDDRPVRLIFCLIGDTDTAADHLAGLARLARLARKDLSILVESENGAEFIQRLRELEEA